MKTTKVEIGDSGLVFEIEDTMTHYGFNIPNYFELTYSISSKLKTRGTLSRSASGNAPDSKEQILSRLPSEIKERLLSHRRYLQAELDEIDTIINGIDHAVEECIKIHYK